MLKIEFHWGHEVVKQLRPVKAVSDAESQGGPNCGAPTTTATAFNPPSTVKLVHLFLSVLSVLMPRKYDIFSQLESTFNFSPFLSKVPIVLLSQGLPSVSGSALRSREIHDLLILGKQATASHNDRFAEKETQKGNLKEQDRPKSGLQLVLYNLHNLYHVQTIPMSEVRQK